MKVLAKNHHWAVFFGIASLGFAVYFPALAGSFLWDDEPLIVENRGIGDWKSIPRTFSQDLGHGSGNQSRFYRPVQEILNRADYFFWKFNPAGYHLTNIVLHIFVSACFFWLVLLLSGNQRLSFFSAAFYVVHPVHTEAVAYISGRADPLAAVFLLLALIFYIKNFHVYSWISFAIALFSKEYALIFPCWIALTQWSIQKKFQWQKLLPYGLIALGYVFIRHGAISLSGPEAVYATTFWQRVPGFFAAVSSYFKFLVWPLDLHMEHLNRLFSPVHPLALAGAALTLSLLVLGWQQRNRRPLVTFSIGWFFIGLLPVSNLFPINAYLAEHWLYLPSMGLFILVAERLDLACHAGGSKKIFYGAFVVVLSLLSVLTFCQSHYWREPIAFYERTLKYSPGSSRVLNNLGNLYAKKGEMEKALGSFNQALQFDPESSATHYNLANTYVKMGQWEAALASFDKAMATGFDQGTLFVDLGIAYRLSGRVDDAIESFKKAVRTRPGWARAQIKLAETYLMSGLNSEAIIEFEKAEQLDPTNADIFVNLGVLYARKGDLTRGIQSFQRALSINPTLETARQNLQKAERELAAGAK